MSLNEINNFVDNSINETTQKIKGLPIYEQLLNYFPQKTLNFITLFCVSFAVIGLLMTAAIAVAEITSSAVGGSLILIGLGITAGLAGGAYLGNALISDKQSSQANIRQIYDVINDIYPEIREKEFNEILKKYNYNFNQIEFAKEHNKEEFRRVSKHKNPY